MEIEPEAVILQDENGHDDEEAIPKKINNYKHLLDSDSEDDKSAVKNCKQSSDSEDDESAVKPLGKSRIIQQSDSSASEAETEKVLPEKPDRRKNANPKKILPVKTQRKSASKAMETIKAKMSHKQETELKQQIQSEKQRMEREQKIRVPYHKPKQYSLKEFLARKSLNKPSLEKIRQGQLPVNSIIALKMRGEELEKFAQKMKEREEEALAFFKSESESDDEAAEPDEPAENDDNAPTDGANESTEVPCETKDETEQTLEPEHQLEAFEKEEAPQLSPSKDPANNHIATTDDIADENPQIQPEPETPAELELTDDPELDRLREKYRNAPETSLHEEVDLKPPGSSVGLKTLREMKSGDFTIDLETGSIQPRKLTGPEMLFQRYLKTVQKPKHKDSISMNILSVENGHLENSKVEIKLEKEIELDHNRPGLSHELLKEGLLNKIVNKRLEGIRKRMAQAESDDKPSCDESVDEEEEDAVETDGESGEAECEEEEDEELEEDDTERPKKKKHEEAGSAFLDKEAFDEDGSQDESEDDESSESSDDEVEPAIEAPRKSRILRAFADSDDEDQPKPDEDVSAIVVNEAFQIADTQQPESEIFDSFVSQPVSSPKESQPKTDENVSASVVNSLNESSQVSDTQQPESEIFDSLASQTVATQKESDDLFSTQQTDFTFNEPSVSEEVNAEGIEALCDSGQSQVKDDEFDFMDILSGQFAPTQANLLGVDSEAEKADDVADSQFVSQVPEREPEEVAPEKVNSPVKNSRALLDSSDDEVDAAENPSKEKRRKRKKRKQKSRKLGFSDDEDDDENVAITEQAEDEESVDELEECEEEQEEDEGDVLVDYDSEENEIEVKVNKKDRIKAAGAYFEQEAELSESEWGSADEDEKELNKYDIELGDEDEFDQDQLQQQVGRIHARKMLDDDLKRVKKIEDLLFENEENDGVGRERKFRWKNQKSFTLDDENARDADLPVDEEDDDESEAAWRKMRHERETVLSENLLNLTESDTMTGDVLLLDHNSSSTSRKFKIIRTSSVMEAPATSCAKNPSPFLIKTASLSKFQTSSFLSRDEKTLSKIAKFVSNKDDEVQKLSNNSNSMSFMTIDKPDDSKKRKSDTMTPQATAKKRKLVTSTKMLLLDQLK